MNLSPDQVEHYRREGYLVIPCVFSEAEVDRLRDELPSLCRPDDPALILEKNTGQVRTIFGSHKTNVVCEHLSRDPRLVEPAMHILDDEVYIHQFKINVKAANGGDIWQWHQDYIYWLNEDGMPAARALTAALWLDDITEFNGPMLLIPGSHRGGVMQVRARDTAPGWVSTVIADLKYAIEPQVLKELVQEHGIVAPKGSRGSLLLFDCNLVHGSGVNISPFDRRIVFVTFNAGTNRLKDVPDPRPHFMAERVFSSIVSFYDNIFSRLAGRRNDRPETRAACQAV